MLVSYGLYIEVEEDGEENQRLSRAFAGDNYSERSSRRVSQSRLGPMAGCITLLCKELQQFPGKFRIEWHKQTLLSSRPLDLAAFEKGYG